MTIERTVVDTNVLISAAIVDGKAAEAVVHEINNSSVLFSSQTWLELKSRIERPKFDRYLTAEEREKFLQLMASIAVPVQASGNIMGCRDLDDDKFLDVAVEGRADCIITGDKDLLDMHPFGSIDIVRPNEYLHLVDQNEERRES